LLASWFYFAGAFFFVAFFFVILLAKQLTPALRMLWKNSTSSSKLPTSCYAFLMIFVFGSIFRLCAFLPYFGFWLFGFSGWQNKDGMLHDGNENGNERETLRSVKNNPEK